MELNVSILINILSQQKTLINELLKLTDQQLQALKQDDAAEILLITGHQEFVLREMAGLEQERMNVLQEFFQKAGVKIEYLSELPPYIGSQDWRTIQDLREEIIIGSQKLNECNILNSLLLKQGLKYTQTMLTILNNSKNSSVYGKTGEVCRTGNNSILDTNV